MMACIMEVLNIQTANAPLWPPPPSPAQEMPCSVMW